MEVKSRILYLQKILLERTDEEHPLSTTQLIGILNDEYGISAHRTTITKDIAALVEYGLDIVTIRSTQNKYFVADRRFELPELKLLIDAVESSKFITKKKSDALIEKIHTLTSSGQVSKLKRNSYIADRIKPDNEQIYYIVDTMPTDFDLAKFTREVFFMYDGNKVTVDLRCDNSLMKTMIDRFGEDVTTLAYDMTSFRLITEVASSQTFLGWVFGFGGKVQILAPESVKEQYREMIMLAAEAMKQSE